MVREEKVGERECEGGEEDMGKKWRGGLLVGNSHNYKRAGPSTPPPTWRLQLSRPPPPRAGASAAAESKEFLTNPPAAAAEVSVRKLCADLWETEQFRSPTMRRRFRKLRWALRGDKIEDEATDVEPPPHGAPPHDHQPLSTGSLRRQISATLGPNDRLVQGNGHALQLVSPASYSSSLEIAACKRAFTPTDSLELKSPSYSLKTSTKLLKVLNRIWSLEEQHAANMSLVKALKTELDQCREEIKELQLEKHTDREGIHGLRENKLVRGRMEQEQLKAAIQSVREELEDERKLRRQSDSLHQKLGRELREVKRCFAKTLRELERERRARVLLENLCDEFAEAVKDYEGDVRRLGNKSPLVERENSDRLIVHVAEAWLDERFQVKLHEDKEDSLGNNSIVDKIGLDIETFLRAIRSGGSRKEKRTHSRLHSLQSNHLNGVDKRCGERKSRSLDLNTSLSRRQGKGSELRENSADLDPVKQRVHSDKLEKVSSSRNPHESSDYRMATSNRRDNQLQLLQDLYGRKSECVDETHGQGLDQALDRMIRNQSLSSEGYKIHPENSPKEVEHRGSHDLEKSRTCSKQPPDMKEDTLQAKLVEARLESRRSRSSKSTAP